MTTEQQRIQQKREQELAQIVNRRTLSKNVTLKDYISEENFDKLKQFLLHSFSTKTAIQYEVTNADYAELFNVIYFGLPFEEITLNIYQLNTVCKMLATGIDVHCTDENEVYDLLLFKVETDPLTILCTEQIEEIGDASFRELQSKLKLESNGQEKSGQTQRGSQA